jgi:hypothetical protein
MPGVPVVVVPSTVMLPDEPEVFTTAIMALWRPLFASALFIHRLVNRANRQRHFLECEYAFSGSELINRRDFRSAANSSPQNPSSAWLRK